MGKRARRTYRRLRSDPPSPHDPSAPMALYLRTLDDNSLSGSVPSQLGRLTALTGL